MTLDRRKGRILQAIVNDYVETADPIGSEWLVSHYNFGCKSATLRNEMAEMAEQGYLVQPHTSAGRIPSDRGYRYYVDNLMSPSALPEGESSRTLHSYAEAKTEVEEIVRLSARFLSSMTRYPSVATPPSLNVTLHRVYITPASPRHILLVLLLSTGHVENRLIEMEGAPSDAALQRITIYMNETLAGLELQEVGRSSLGEIPSPLVPDKAVIARVHTNITASVRALASDRLFIEGTSHILRQREFQDVIRLERLLSVLEHRSALLYVFSQALWRRDASQGASRGASQDALQDMSQDVSVIIGTESPVEAMQDCSVITTRYHIGERSGGFIGIVGPTRMHYDHAVAAVSFMARALSSLLTQVSLE